MLKKCDAHGVLKCGRVKCVRRLRVRGGITYEEYRHVHVGVTSLTGAISDTDIDIDAAADIDADVNTQLRMSARTQGHRGNI